MVCVKIQAFRTLEGSERGKYDHKSKKKMKEEIVDGLARSEAHNTEGETPATVFANLRKE